MHGRMPAPPPTRPRTRLYLITPPQVTGLAAFEDAVDEALDGGDIACLQFRLKLPDGRIDTATTRALAEGLAPRLRARDVAIIINDSPELARELGADGVHLGPEDMEIRAARRLLGPDMIIGASARNSRHDAMEAGEAGADYVAFGAFYPTGTKAGTVPADPEILEIWQETMELPCVAIGGITVANAAPLVRAGADFLAVSAGIWQHPGGPAAAVRAFNSLFDQLDPCGPAA